MTRGGEVAERGGRAAGHADAEIGVVELPFLPAASRDGRPSLESPSVGARRRRVHPLGPSAASAVTRLANRLGVTPADVVAAAYTAVLHRYQATDRLIVGLHHHDGPRSFVVDGSGEPAAAEWIRRIVDALDGAHDHDDAETGTCRLVRDRPPQGEGAEVTLGMAPDEGDLTLVMELEERAGSHPAAPRFLAHVANVVAGFVDQPATPIDALHIVTDGERALLAQWNDTDRTYPGHPTLVDLFDQQVARTPTAVALVGPEGDQLTYRDLAHRVAQLAGWLQVNGVGPGSRVGVLAERAPELVVALHAVLRAGGAYVPLDPEYPAERLAFMADEAELSIVLTQQHLRAVVPPGDRIVLALDEQWDEVEATPAPATGPAVEPDAPAYVLYTSGSTGTPKGVVNTHRGIANRLQWMQEHLQLTAADAVLQKTPFSFDVSVWELFWPLQVGARLVLARPGGHRDPAYLRQLVAERGITALHFVPSMLRLFLDHDAAPAARELPAGVRHVVCSGEALTAELRDRFVRRWPGPELHNLYGPTEAAVDVTWWRCRPTDRSAVVPIGRPVANTRIHVLDHRRQPVPIGVAGELCIGGVQVAQGYLRRPELTAERFVDEPGGSGRLYRTGDLARWRDDGQLEFLGRTDHQVKIRGNRIELGEIEATIVAHSAVAGAAVTVHDRRHGPQLAAHYTLFQPASVSPATIRAHVGTMLPAFMVPNLFIEHDELPLATSGKVDRHALGAAVATRATVTGDLVAPNDELERFLADVWAEVLGLDQVGVTDRFFELGGDSIQAAEVVNRVQEAVGEFVYVVTMFTSPTVADYARMLRRDYGPAVAARFGASTTDTGGPGPQPGARATSLADRLATLRSAVPRFGPGASWQEGSPNHRAIFVLSPPRSGTSLLRLMLAGHPALFAASELQLLHFDTLAQRRRAFDGRFRLWGEGTIRALMELQGLDAVAATAAMAAAEDADGSVKAFVAQLQEQLGSRILVDKSPSYALDRHAVDNAEAGFDRPFYVHLVRDPHEMVHSFVDYHMDQVLFLDPHGLSAPELAEAVWVESHRTILDFLSTVPADRQLRLRFEDLVDRPRASMEQLTSAVGLDFDDGLVDPYRDLGRKMVDGLHASSTPMGDTRLLERDAIDPGVVDQWRRRSPADVLDPETWSLAASFGYVPPPSPPSAPAPTGHGNGAGRRRQQAAARQRRRRGRR